MAELGLDFTGDLGTTADIVTLPPIDPSRFKFGVRGFDGNDRITGSVIGDLINGNRDNDFVAGGDGNDTLRGGKADDFITGNLGQDVLYGDRGNDILRGGRASDTLFGGEGDDVLAGDGGQDILEGGPGRDTFVFDLKFSPADATVSDVVIDFDPTSDVIGLTDGLTGANLKLEATTGGTIIREATSGNVLGRVNNVTPAQLQNRFVPATQVFDNAPQGASDLGALVGKVNLSGAINDENPIDLYKFSVTSNSLIKANLTGLKADADLTLLRDSNGDGRLTPDEVVATSANLGTAPESLDNLPLTPGTYFLRVEQYEESTPYQLAVELTPNQTRPDGAGNTLAQAKDLGTLGVANVSDLVGGADPADVYRFAIAQNAQAFNATATSNASGLAIELIQDRNQNQTVDPGEVLAQGKAGEIAQTLLPGTYFLRATSPSETLYQLSLGASPGSGQPETYPSLSPNETIQGALTRSDRANSQIPGTVVDEYLLSDARVGQKVSVSLASSKFDALLEVIDQVSGQVVAKNEDLDATTTNAGLGFTVERGKQYLVRVTSETAGFGDYTLTTKTAAPTIVPLSAGQTLSGALTQDDLRDPVRPDSFSDTYQLQGLAANAKVQIDLKSTAFNGYLQLIDARSGQVLDQNNDGTTDSKDAQLSFFAQAGIDYLVRVNSFLANETGNYTIEAKRLADPVVVPELKVGDRTTGQLATNDAAHPTRSGSFKDDYALAGLEPGQKVRLNLASEKFDAFLELVDATSGAVLASNDNASTSTKAAQVEFTAEAGKSYLARVTSSKAAEVGTYELASTLVVVPNPSPNPQPVPVPELKVGDRATGQLTTSDVAHPSRTGSFKDDYALTGLTTSQKVRLNLASDKFDAFLELVDATSGAVLASNDNASTSTKAAQVEFTAEAGKSYLARVTSSQTAEVGTYELTSTVVVVPTPTPTPELKVGEIATGELAISDTVHPTRAGSFKDDYALTGLKTDQKVRLDLDSAKFDAFLELVDATSGTVLKSNDNASASTKAAQVEFTAEAGKSYLARVTSSQAAGVGTYELVSTIATDPVPTPNPTEKDFFDKNLKDPNLRTKARAAADDGVLSRTEVLNLMASATTDDSTNGTTVSQNELDDFNTLASNGARFSMPDPVVYLTKKVFEDAKGSISKGAFEAIVGRRFRGTEIPANEFVDNGTSISLIHETVQGQLVGTFGTLGSDARITQIRQGSFGTCAFLAAVGATFGKLNRDNADSVASSVLKDSLINNGDNTYTVRFFANGAPQYVTVNALAPGSKGQIFGAGPAQRNPGDGLTATTYDFNNRDNYPIWMSLMERAYAQWMGEQENINGYTRIGNGDTRAEPLARVTGRFAEEFDLGSDPNLFGRINSALQSGEFVTVGMGGRKKSSAFLVGSHVYTVVDAYSLNGENKVLIRNPWGFDGDGVLAISRDGQQDGFVELTYDEFTDFFGSVAITQKS